MSATTAYIAASANRFSHVADITSTALVAFGSGKLIALWNTDDKDDTGVYETLPAHQGNITCIKFLSDDVLCSADETGTLLCWRKVGSEWNPTVNIKAHTTSISALCVHDNAIITGSSDTCVKVWDFFHVDGSDTIQERQTIALKGKYPLAIALTHLPGTNVSILAVAGTEKSVQLWLRSEENFVHSAVLSGHEDWIRGLSFDEPRSAGEPLVLASGSQDATIRLWRIEPWKREQPSAHSGETISDDLLDAFEASLGDLADGEEGGRQISLKHHVLTAKLSDGSSSQFSVTFDALLVGHDAGIASIAWSPRSTSQPCLLSTSTDSSVILWSPSEVFSTGKNSNATIWINQQRFGDIGGQRLGGFVGGFWASEGKDVMAWGWSGGWRRWHCRNDIGTEKYGNWEEIGAISGHSGPVKGIDWSPGGEYLISTGVDQTTRLHGPVPGRNDQQTWHELARPQVHGYDLLNVVFVGPLGFISIADEKVARVFEAPRNFASLVENLGMAKFTENVRDRPLAASVPPLGLSNKAISEDSEAKAPHVPTHRRPFEGELSSSTLWPEVEKIFGHGYESITLGISHSRKRIATACKATNPEHALIRIYDTNTYRSIGEPLAGHALTVTRIAFSSDDRLILSVSRDRSWRLFEMQPNGGYAPVAADKSHSRIIWDCAWNADSNAFATASRDKTVKVWKSISNVWKPIFTIKTESSATAVAFASKDISHRNLLAVGLESGNILIYSATSDSVDEWNHCLSINSRRAHNDHIYRLAWRPHDMHELASCSEDGTLRILSVHLPTD
ncbi:WD40 repeat-like protein [Cyathus striatus]|nr:WD40 repeat-like protein [Cyathus striatus]